MMIMTIVEFVLYWLIMSNEHDDFKILPSTGLTHANDEILTEYYSVSFSMMIVRILIGFDIGRFRRMKNGILTATTRF